jgi:FKBP-type peptidyl-prolyl cis-trans isomerase SlyD
MNTVLGDAFVAIEYTLTLGSGEVVDKSPAGKPLGIIMGNGQIIPGLERALVGRNLGDAFAVDVLAVDGYGDVDEEMIQTMSRKNFPNSADLEVGMVFQAQTPHGAVSFRVKEVLEDDVVVDFNHPLAGEKLHFDVKIVEVRETTEEDLRQLHEAHGCDGSRDCSGCHG